MKGSDISKNRPCYFKKMGLKSSKPCYLRCVLESEIFGFNKAETLVRDLTPLPNMCVCGGGGVVTAKGKCVCLFRQRGSGAGDSGDVYKLWAGTVGSVGLSGCGRFRGLRGWGAGSRVSPVGGAGRDKASAQAPRSDGQRSADTRMCSSSRNRERPTNRLPQLNRILNHFKGVPFTFSQHVPPLLPGVGGLRSSFRLALDDRVAPHSDQSHPF